MESKRKFEEEPRAALLTSIRLLDECNNAVARNDIEAVGTCLEYDYDNDSPGTRRLNGECRYILLTRAANLKNVPLIRCISIRGENICELLVKHLVNGQERIEFIMKNLNVDEIFNRILIAANPCPYYSERLQKSFYATAASSLIIFRF